MYFQPHCGPYLMKTKITQAELKKLLHYDPETGIFTRRIRRSNRPAGVVVGSWDMMGYLTIWCLGKSHKSHRLAWLYMTGSWPERHIDHINGVPHDNRWCNLRQAEVCENMWNARIASTNTSGIKGVCWDRLRQKWKARFRVNGRVCNVGRFETREEAADAVRKAREKHHGLFANHG